MTHRFSFGKHEMSQSFFEERTDQSEVKARIIDKYFYAWARVVGPSARSMGGKIAYIDLYAGPGRYRDGSASTPLLILERAVADADLCSMLVALFNDQDSTHSNTLRNEIKKIPNITNLKYEPQVYCSTVDSDAENYFKDTPLVPTFTFFDPFGYKGLSLGIIQGVIKDWGCDCVFFFNYNRINMGLSNELVDKHIDALFGVSRAKRLRETIDGKSPARREELILEELCKAIKNMGGTYVLPFRFRNEKGTRLSHSLIFVSKHFKGYEIMKEIMAKESSTHEENVPSLEYSPASSLTPFLLGFLNPIDDLGAALLKDFKSSTVSMVDIYKSHSVDTNYIKRNYKSALLELEKKGLIDATPKSRKKNTFADSVMVTFP